jgi:hypothetical protein
MSTVVLLIFEACIPHLIHVKLIKFDILVYSCIAYGNVKRKKFFHRVTSKVWGGSSPPEAGDVFLQRMAKIPVW